MQKCFRFVVQYMFLQMGNISIGSKTQTLTILLQYDNTRILTFQTTLCNRIIFPGLLT